MPIFSSPPWPPLGSVPARPWICTAFVLPELEWAFWPVAPGRSAASDMGKRAISRHIRDLLSNARLEGAGRPDGDCQASCWPLESGRWTRWREGPTQDTQNQGWGPSLWGGLPSQVDPASTDWSPKPPTVVGWRNWRPDSRADGRHTVRLR